MPENYDPNRIKELADATIRYLQSPEGKRTLEQNLREGREFVERFKAARKISLEELQEPVTI